MDIWGMLWGRSKPGEFKAQQESPWGSRASKGKVVEMGMEWDDRSSRVWGRGLIMTHWCLTRITLTTGLRIDWRQVRAEKKDELRGYYPTGWKPLFPAAFPSVRQATRKCVQPALAMSSCRIRFNLCSVRKPKKSRENGAGHEGYSFSGNKKKNKIAICIFDNQGNWLDWSRLRK